MAERKTDNLETKVRFFPLRFLLYGECRWNYIITNDAGVGSSPTDLLRRIVAQLDRARCFIKTLSPFLLERRHPDGKRRVSGVNFNINSNWSFINDCLNAFAFIAVKMTAFRCPNRRKIWQIKIYFKLSKNRAIYARPRRFA